MVPLFLFKSSLAKTLLAFASLALLFNMFMPLIASAAAPSAFSEIETQTERWMRMRGVYGCLYEKGLPYNSSEQVLEGHFANNGETAIGYLNEDGKVGCDDGDFITNSNDIIGFEANDYSYCAAQPSSYRTNGPDTGSTSNLEGCVGGSGSFNNAEDHKKIASQWLSGLKTQVTDYKSFMSDTGGQSDQSKYYMYVQSLVKFCGAKQDAKYEGTAREKSIVEGDDKKVVINVVDGTGEIQPYVYTLTKFQNQTVDDVYQEMGSDSKDLSCEFMAERTWELDSTTATWVKTYNKNNADAPTDGMDQKENAGGVEETSTCAIDGVGWIVCPAITFLGKLNDASFGILNNFLEVRPDLITDAATKEAWSKFRDIANVAFVISFLVIVYSQVTSIGVSNYGIKKLVPKLFVAAVLVNISFWVCAAAVDISNILGASIYDLFKSFEDGMNAGGGGGLDQQIGDMWSNVIAVVLGAGGIALLLVLLVTAPTALLALGVVVLILIARQALVLLLVVIAPIAFVAYILPNTESWFTKWRKTFTAALLVYPVVAVIFGASTLAATILLRVAGDAGNATGDGDDTNMLKIIALGVLAVPLFTVPAVLKGSLAAIGSIGGRISGLQDRSNGFARKKVAGSRLGEAKGAFDARRQENRVKRRMDPTAKRFGVPVGKMNTAFDQSSLGKRFGGDRGAAAATSAYHKIAYEEMERQGSTLSEMPVEELVKVYEDKNASAERRGAALKRVSEIGGHQHVQAAYDYLLAEGGRTGDDKDKNIGDVQQFAADSLLKRKPAGVGASDANAMRTGTMGGEGYMASLQGRIEVGKFGAQEIANMDVDDHVRIAELASTGQLSDGAINALTAHLDEIRDSDTMKLTPEQERILTSAIARQAPTRPDGTAYNLTDLPGNRPPQAPPAP